MSSLEHKCFLVLFLIFVFFSFIPARLIAQEISVQGIVFDRDSKQRLTRVYLHNLQTGGGFYNNTRGEFSVNLSEGTFLEASLIGYEADTIKCTGINNVVLFYLKRNSIQLPEVLIKDTIQSPEKKLKENKSVYKDAYVRGNTDDILTQQGGIGIDGLYNLFSKEGRNARHLQRIIEGDYYQAVINSRYTSSLVGRVTGLLGDNLVDFMQQYRPCYEFMLKANEYELIRWIKLNYQYYRQDPTGLRLPSLRISQ